MLSCGSEGSARGVGVRGNRSRTRESKATTNRPTNSATEIAHDRLHCDIGMDAADRAGGVVADAERRREQADAHREDHHHRVVHLVDADLARDREQQRPEQHDRRDALEHAAEHDEGHDRDRDERRRAARHAAHRAARCCREARLRQRPGHAGGGADDEQDRARERRGVDQHRIEPLPVELAVDQQARTTRP